MMRALFCHITGNVASERLTIEEARQEAAFAFGELRLE
jgi:hypothetical protein